MKAIKEELLRWTCKMHATNSYLDRHILREKALELTRLRGLNGFKCSERWMNDFLKGHGFSVDLTDDAGPTFADYRDWIELLRSTITKYKHNDLFSVDELVMYADVLPSRVRSDLNEDEPPRNRITVLMGCNSSGTVKLPLLICGTYPSRITLKEHVYCHDEHSCIGDELFRNWLSSVNDRMAKCNRKILLLLRRNRARALKDFTSSNLKLVYLPESFPPALRPLRRDIFHYVKMIVRRRYTERLKQYTEEWNLRDILASLIEAWETIPSEIIIHSFQRTHFRTDNHLLQMNCNCWDSLKVGISFKKFVTFDDKLSDELPCYKRSNRYRGYNLRASGKEMVHIDEDNGDTITQELARNDSSEMCPRCDRDRTLELNDRMDQKLTGTEARQNVDQRLDGTSKEIYRNARRIFTKRNTLVERKSRKRAYSETRATAKLQCNCDSRDGYMKNHFASRHINVTSSKSICGKTFKHEQPQRYQTERNGIKESLQAIVDKALTLASYVDPDYTKKLIDSIPASIRQISRHANDTNPSKAFQREATESNCTSEQVTKTRYAKMKEGANKIATNSRYLERDNEPSTSTNHANLLPAIVQSGMKEGEGVFKEPSSKKHNTTDLDRGNCKAGRNIDAKVNLKYEGSSVRQEVSDGLKKKREKPCEDDSVADEPSEKISKMDHDWSKQFETTFVFGSQNSNCSLGVRHDDHVVDSCVFKMKPSVTPRD